MSVLQNYKVWYWVGFLLLAITSQKTVVKILNVQQKQEGFFTQVILFAYYFQDVLNIVVG